MAVIAQALEDPQVSLGRVGGPDFGRQDDDGRTDRAHYGRPGQRQRREEFQVNVPNNGALEGIPDDVVVEVPAIIDRKGIQPLHVSALPAKIMLEHVLPEWLGMERQLEAFKTGDRSMLLWSVLDGHQTRSYDQAASVLDDLLAMDGHAGLAEFFQYPSNWRWDE